MSKQKPQHQTAIDDIAETLPAVIHRRTSSLSPSSDSGPMEWPTNFDLATPAGKAGLINAGNPPAWRPADGGTYTILATHWCVCPAESVDEETGETHQYIQTIFVAADGTNVKLSAEWAVSRMRAMLMLYTPEEWAAGLKIQCYVGESRRGGRRYGSFRVVPSQDTVS